MKPGRFIVPDGQPRSAWDAVKLEPARPSPARMRAFLVHLRWLREQTADDALVGIPDQKLRQFAAEARSLNAADLSRMMEAKRLTLVAALLRRRAAGALDEATEMFVRLTARMHNRAKEALEEHLKRHAEETDALVALLRETVIAAKGAGDAAARLAAIDALLLPDADGVIERCEAHAALAGGNHLPLLGRLSQGAACRLHPLPRSRKAAVDLAGPLARGGHCLPARSPQPSAPQARRRARGRTWPSSRRRAPRRPVLRAGQVVAARHRLDAP